MQQETAYVLALRVLGWLAGQDELFDSFLGQSGADAGQVRGLAQDPAFLCAVLDFVLQSDAWVIGCAAELGERPEALVQARALLGGGDQLHWT
ncbi:DUF3572 domain-containing protein [Paenirhodobacter sp. CAU 1674]|uniref:DUF3572 domain-containing protein n=1 Tax=Paenirhodobacter sp. CAU 1674 TaxID=3032596 RepID=UPI0023DB6FA5|nr:DUF3572 domain-containing protein [Paenirhodobacter sp. CAU 1674]MDF2140154.1 DUF3572 domain-containing protein [Paenirhodobacter sp. CAU 1674]